MEKLTEIVDMGGYGAYVWPSFLMTALLMIGMVAGSIRSLKKAQKALASLQDTSSHEA